MLARIAWSLGMVVAASLVATAPVAAQLEKAGVVTTLQGTATVARAGLPQPSPLKFKDDVFLRDRITTGDDSVARILLGGKAIVTVRERSVLTITEAPGLSTIEVGTGRMALAVAKERMKPGESIQIRTPNAIAGIRGTVVITEVEEATAQVGAATRGFTTTFTFTRGSGEVNYLDANRRPGPAWTAVTAGQQSRVLGATPPRPPVTLTPGALQQLTSSFQPKVKEAPPATNVPLASTQMSQGVADMERYVRSGGGPTPGAQTPPGQPTGTGGGEERSGTGGPGTQSGPGTPQTPGGPPGPGAPTITGPSPGGPPLSTPSPATPQTGGPSPGPSSKPSTPSPSTPSPSAPTAKAPAPTPTGSTPVVKAPSTPPPAPTVRVPSPVPKASFVVPKVSPQKYKQPPKSKSKSGSSSGG